jgi:anaerobic magnesium-protoporphyrin IX monomethyl ester cyclase
MSLMALAAYLREHGYEVDLHDFQLNRREISTFDFSPYDVVGIGTNTSRFPISMKIAKHARAAGAFVVMGGPHPGYVPEETLATGDVDAVAIGEGEETLLELVRAIEKNEPLDDIAGLAFRRNGEVVTTPDRPIIKDLDSLPFPARELLDVHRYRGAMIGDRPVTNLCTSRGCSHNCHFCSSARFWGRRLRVRSAESVLSELEEVYEKYGYRAVAFVDDNFAAIPSRVKAICQGIIDRGWDIWWWCLGRADHIVRNPDMVEMMARAGCRTIYIGVESASNASLAAYDKQSDETTVEKAFAIIRQNGIQIFSSYMLGGLDESHADAEATIELARRLDSNVAQFSILTPYPGTELFEQLKDRLRHRNWSRYDSMHLVFKHPKISAFRMYGFLIKANVRFYTRSRESRQGFVKVMKRGGIGVRHFARMIRDHVRGS